MAAAAASSFLTPPFPPKPNPISTNPFSIKFHYKNHTPFLPPSFTLTTTPSKRIVAVLAVAEEQQQESVGEEAVSETVNGEGYEEDEDEEVVKFRDVLRRCELYVCNLPRSCGIVELFGLFSPHGVVQAVEVSRNPETGISRGCGYVTMSSVDQSKAAISALDGSDVDGREMRVRFSADMAKRNLEPLDSQPKRSLIFESPHKLYVGNLSWAVKPDDLRSLFNQFGTVVSAKVLHDRKSGRNRVYGFVSFSSPDELEAAISLNGTEYFGRTIIVREGVKQEP